jgi:hypothetical protein
MSVFQILEQVLSYLPFFEGLSPIIPTVIDDLGAIENLTAANSTANFDAFKFFAKGHQYQVGPIPVVRLS